MAYDLTPSLSQKCKDAFETWEKEQKWPSCNALFRQWELQLVAIGIPSEHVAPILIAQLIAYALAVQMHNYPAVNKATALSDFSLIYDRLGSAEKVVLQ